ncbi:hypothetical protein BB561_001825 [Smittium simulii]|uniref:Arf-GAP domain-containing protein n=1 Tax=Smittium simulii TaxID=133385 RepID=A0A2T9YST2_9FUNG|nr:hypothetical protein BB561_001825 [Smittium simulii]
MWFEIQGLNLVYDVNQNGKDMAFIPLMLTKTKDSASDLKDVSEKYSRPFLFELIGPQQSFILQADSEIELSSWLEHIKLQIQLSIYHFGHSTPDNKSIDINQLYKSKSKNHIFLKNHVANSSDFNSIKSLKKNIEFSNPNESLDFILNLPGNKFCADCGVRNPTWAIVNFGVLVCINCSGMHRKLGVQISKVKSIQLDKIDSECLHILQRLGNSNANSFLDPNSDDKPTSKSSNDSIQAYISNKYALKKYLLSIENTANYRLSSEFDKANINDMLYKSIFKSDLQMILRLLLLGADPNYIDKESNNSVLIAAVENLDYAAVEILIMHGADVNLFIQPTQNIDINDKLDSFELESQKVTVKHADFTEKLQKSEHSIKTENICSTNEDPVNLSDLKESEVEFETISSSTKNIKISQDNTLPDSNIGKTEKISSFNKEFIGLGIEDLNGTDITEKGLTDCQPLIPYSNIGPTSITSIANTENICSTLLESNETGNEYSPNSEAITIDKLNNIDSQKCFKKYGGTAIHAAACRDDAAMIVYLMRKRANAETKNILGLKPIDIAVLFGNAMVVMTIRYFTFIKCDDLMSLDTIANTLDENFSIPQKFNPNMLKTSQ